MLLHILLLQLFALLLRLYPLLQCRMLCQHRLPLRFQLLQKRLRLPLLFFRFPHQCFNRKLLLFCLRQRIVLSCSCRRQRRTCFRHIFRRRLCCLHRLYALSYSLPFNSRILHCCCGDLIHNPLCRHHRTRCRIGRSGPCLRLDWYLLRHRFNLLYWIQLFRLRKSGCFRPSSALHRLYRQRFLPLQLL